MKIARTQLKIHNLIDVRKKQHVQYAPCLASCRVPSPYEQKTNDSIVVYSWISWIFSVYSTLKEWILLPPHLPFSPSCWKISITSNAERLCHCCERSHAVIPKPNSCASASRITSLKIITAWLEARASSFFAFDGSRGMGFGEWPSLVTAILGSHFLSINSATDLLALFKANKWSENSTAFGSKTGYGSRLRASAWQTKSNITATGVTNFPFTWSISKASATSHANMKVHASSPACSLPSMNLRKGLEACDNLRSLLRYEKWGSFQTRVRANQTVLRRDTAVSNTGNDYDFEAWWIRFHGSNLIFNSHSTMIDHNLNSPSIRKVFMSRLFLNLRNQLIKNRSRVLYLRKSRLKDHHSHPRLW